MNAVLFGRILYRFCINNTKGRHLLNLTNLVECKFCFVLKAGITYSVPLYVTYCSMQIHWQGRENKDVSYELAIKPHFGGKNKVLFTALK
jgi:hypothetical protein